MVVVMTACSMRSVIADGFVAIWTWTASADPAGEGATGVAALLAQLSFTAVGAFVNGVYSRRGRRPRGRVVGGVGGNAVFLHALLQWVCRSVGVKPRWQTGQGVVPWSSRGRPATGTGRVLWSGRSRSPAVRRRGGFPGVAHAVGLAVGDDDGGVVQESVQDADGGGVFRQETARLVERPV